MRRQFLVLGAVLIGLSFVLRAENTPPEDNDSSPYHQALFDFKTGHYDKARTAIDAAEQTNPNDLSTALLKARILIEQKDFVEAKKVLEGMNGKAGLTPEIEEARTLTFGDLCLRKRSFDEAAKFYESLLSQKPGDPDLILKIVYTRVGASDLVEAGKYASQLKPLDPKNPYDTHASYYFAKAALAQAENRSQEADDDIETARTIYGLTVTNRYLKTYLQVFSSSDKNSATTKITPPPLLAPTPTGTK